MSTKLVFSLSDFVYLLDQDFSLKKPAIQISRDQYGKVRLISITVDANINFPAAELLCVRHPVERKIDGNWSWRDSNWVVECCYGLMLEYCAVFGLAVCSARAS